MDVGAITMRMAADTGQLRSDMSSAKDVVKQATSEMAQSTKTATAATADYTLSTKLMREQALAAAAAQSELADKVMGMAGTAGKSEIEILKARAALQGMTDTLKPYFDQIDKATTKTHELSLANAGVTREISVLAREAANGNWSRFEGSLSVLASRTGLLELAFSATGAAIAGTVAIFGAFGYAAYKGYEESENLRKSLAETGGYAGLTEDSFRSLAKTVAGDVSSGIGKAKDALQDLAKTGRVAGDAMGILAEDMVRQQELTGAKMDEIAKDYSKMADGVAKWAEAHNKAMHFMSVAQYEHIQLLEEQGKKQEAMIEVGNLLKDHFDTQVSKLGYLQQAWQKLGGVMDWVMGLGRAETAGDAASHTASVVDYARSSLKAAQDNGFSPGVVAQRQKGLDTALAAQQAAQDAILEQKRQTAHTAEMASINEEGIAALDWYNKKNEQFDKGAQRQKLYQEASKNFAALEAAGHGLTIEQQQTILDGIDKQTTAHEKHAKVVQDYYGTLLASINAYGASAQQELDKGEKLTAADKFRNAEIEKMVAAYNEKRITFQQLLDLEAAMEVAALKRQKAEDMEGQNKLLAEQNKQIDVWMAADQKSLDQLDKRIAAQEQSNAQIGMTKAQIDALKASQDDANATSEEAYSQALRNAAVYAGPFHDAYIQAANDAHALAVKMKELSADAAAGGVAQAAADAAKKAEEAWTHADKSIEDGLYSAISSGGGNAFKKLLSDVKNWFAHLILQPIIQPIGQLGASIMNGGASSAASSMFSTAPGGMLDTAAGWFGGGSGIGGAAISSAEVAGTVDATSTALISAGASATEAASAATALGGTMTTATGALTTALAAIPVWGWAALAAIAIFSSSSSGGGPKSEGGYAPNGLNIGGVDIGGNMQGSQRGDVATAQGLSKGISDSYTALATQLGLVKKQLDVGVFFSKDNAPGGTSLTQLQVTSSAGYNRGTLTGGIENVGRSDAEFQTAVTDATSQLLLQALKNSDLAAQYKAILNSVADTANSADIQAAIAHVTAAKTQEASLTEQIYQLTATAEEKLTRTRNAERAAVDPLNAALLEQLYAKQDALTAEAAATAAATQAAQDQAKAQADLAAATAAATAALKTATDTAFTSLQTSVTAARQVAAQQVTDLSALSSLLGNSISQLYGQGSTAGMTGAAGSKFIAQALSAAKSTGYLPDATQLGGAITAASGGVNNTANFQSQQQQDFARLVLAGQLTQLKDLTDPQLTAAQQQVKYLDDLVASAQTQLDALRGIDNSVKSVADALAAFRAALLHEGGTSSTGAASTAGAGAAGGSAFSGVQGGGSNYIPPLDTVRAFLRTLNWSTPQDSTSSLFKVYDQASIKHWNSNLIAQAFGQPQDAVLAQFAALGLPSFAVGTNYLPKDMVVQAHEGEAIVPKAYNPAAGGSSGSGNSDALQQRVEHLITVCTQIVINTRSTADVFQRAQGVSGGSAIAVTTVAAGT